jgi:protease I
MRLVLINAKRIKDKNLTSYKSIRLDLENAGANWVDETVHRCNTGGWVLISSRNPMIFHTLTKLSFRN